jgi:hypothetical protein
VSKLGVGASIACMVHCLALPVMAGTAAGAHDHLHSVAWLEPVLVGVAALVGYGTLAPSFRRHRRPLPLVLLTLGLLLIVAGHLQSPTTGPTVPVIGALLLAAAQLLNRRLPSACCSP